MITTDLNPELRDYLLEQEERRKRTQNPEYEAQAASMRSQDFEASRAPQEVAAYAKAFSQLGTLGGKSADTSSLQQNADQINKAQGMQRQQEMQDEQSRDRDTGLRMQTLQYLQGRTDKDADRQRQDQSAEMADKRARDLAQMQSDRAYGLASMTDKRARELAEFNADKSYELERLKGDREERMAGLKSKTPDKAAQKSQQESDYRYISLKNNSNKLKDLVKNYGTAELTGPAGAEMDSLIYQMAVDYAKLVDPDSVAREGEVAAAQKYMLPFRQGITDQLFTKNDTAIKQIDNYRTGLDERLAARKAAQAGDLSAQTYKPDKLKTGFEDTAQAASQAEALPPPPPGKVRVRRPDGKIGFIPINQLEEALSNQYTEVQ